MEMVQTESQRVYKRKNKEVMREDDDEVPLTRIMERMKRPKGIVIEEPKEDNKRVEIQELEDDWEVKLQGKKAKMTTYDWTTKFEVLYCRSTPKPVVNLLKTMNNLQKKQ